jgi:hypothetical protein
MNIKNYDFRFLIMANLIFILILYVDFTLPSIHNKTEKIKSFYNSVNYTPGWKSKSSTEIKYILECESGSVYYLGKFPQEFENIENEKKVDIERTLLFKKVKSLKVENKTYSVSFLSLNMVMYIFTFCIVINLLNIFFTNKVLDIILAFGTVPIYFVGLVYIFSY